MPARLSLGGHRTPRSAPESHHIIACIESEMLDRVPDGAHLVAGAARQAVSQAGELCRRRDRTVCGQELPWLGRMSVTATVTSSDTAFCTSHNPNVSRFSIEPV